MTAAGRLIAIAAGLVSENAENAEHDRACSEIVTEYLGLPMDESDTVLKILRVKKGWM